MTFARRGIISEVPNARINEIERLKEKLMGE